MQKAYLTRRALQLCFKPSRPHQEPAPRQLSSLCRSNKEEGDLLTNIEDEARKKEQESNVGKGFGKPQPKPKKKRPQLDSNQQKAKSELSAAEKPFSTELNRPLTQADKWEQRIVGTLAVLFLIFFAEGLFLAVAGFLPEAADDFAVKYVYPAFSPTLGIFLTISVVYGLLKTRQQQQN